MATFSGAGLGVLLTINTFHFHTLDIFIFVALLALTLIVGLSTSRKSETIQDYALGGKNFSTLTLTATIIATWFGGGSLYYALANTYSQGLYFVLALLGTPFALLFAGRVLAVRMGTFLESVSVAAAMGSMYGNRIRMISAISGITGQIGMVALQFQVITRILALFLGIQDESLTIIAAILVILYSSMGGIRAVTFTDVVQFFVFGTFVPLLALVIWNSFQDPNRVTTMLAGNPNFHLNEVVGWNTRFISTVSLTLVYTLGGMTPPIFQRISMARNARQAKKAFTYAAIISLLIFACIAWVGVLLLADNPHLEPGKLVNYLLDTYTYVGFKGFMAASILALAMSTADSSLNSCSILIANDIATPLGLRKNNLALYARLSTWGIGVLALLLSLYENDLLALLLLAASFYMPIAGTPLLLAILGFRSTPRVVLISMAVGFISVILWRAFFLHTGIDSIMPSTFANLITMLSVHYLLGEPGGWQKISPDSPLARERAARREAWQRRKKAINNFKLYPYLQQNLPQQEGLYALLGFYTIAATYTGLYTIGNSDIQSHREIYEGIYHTVLFATTAFVTFPIWPATVKSYRFMTLFWPLGMGAILFFAGTLLVIISEFHTMQVMVLAVNLLIAVSLLQWSLALSLAIGGASLAVWFFYYYTGERFLWHELGSLQFSLLYGALLITSFLIILFRGKQAFAQLGKKNETLKNREKDQQESLAQAATEKQAALAAFQHTGAEQLLTITRELQTMHVAEEEKGRMTALQTKLLPIAFHLQGVDTRAQDYLRLKKAKLTLKPWCEQIKEEATQKGVTLNIHCRNDAKVKEINSDVPRLTSLLVKSMVALSTQAEGLEDKPTIFFKIEDTQLSYPLPDVKPGYIKYVPAVRMALTVGDDLPAVKDSYASDLIGRSEPTMVEAFTHFIDSRLIKSHYGYSEVTSDTLIYVIPVDIEDVRPKDMDKDYMEVGAKPKRADDHFKDDKGIDAQVQEAAFLADVAARSDADLGMVRMALETIKWYHGPKNRNSGEPFYLHPLTVAHIVLDYDTDEETIISALLHDTVEDTPMQLEHIEAMFGKETAKVVDVVTHLQSIEGSIYKIKMSASENLQMLDRTDRTKGLYVKIADRMHNMRTIKGHSKVSKRKLIAQETADFFVPLARKLGLKGAAQEFRERCEEVLQKNK